MPEDSDKKEIEQFEKCVNKKKKKTQSIVFKEPRLLASFILTQEPGYVWLDGRKIKNKWPNLRMSVKKINDMMDTDEFRQAVREQIPDCTKEKSAGMFNMLLLKYFDAQMQLECPHQGALKIFGQISGLYDPTQKLDISGTMSYSEEKEKNLKEEVAKILARRLKQEKGDGDGDNE